MKTKKQFLVFISYGHGAHFNTVVDSVENVIEVLDNSCDEIEQDLLDEVSIEISALENEKNFYTEFNHGTWATITRMDVDNTGITDREAIAVINALRVYQAEDDREDIINDFGLDQDKMTDDEIENLIQNNVKNDARNLVGFANAIINTMTTNDMIDIIGQRAYDAGIVNSRGNICLTSINSITASQRDTAERCNGASSVSDGGVLIDTEEYDGYDEIVKNAAKFGVSYVLAF